MSNKTSNNVKKVKASVIRAKAILKDINKENLFRKNDDLEKVEIPIHPGQMKLHLFPVIYSEEYLDNKNFIVRYNMKKIISL